MKRGDDLRAAIEAAPLFAQTTITYRVTNLVYFETLTSTKGARISNNRFTEEGMCDALYVADAPDLALLEATQGYQNEFRAPEIPAHAFYPVYIEVLRILDLTNLDICDSLDLGLMTLTGDWRAALQKQAQDARHRVETHEIGRACFELGLEGIRYPSSFDGFQRQNYVLFTENMAAPPESRLPEVILEAQAALAEKRSRTLPG